MNFNNLFKKGDPVHTKIIMFLVVWCVLCVLVCAALALQIRGISSKLNELTSMEDVTVTDDYTPVVDPSYIYTITPDVLLEPITATKYEVAPQPEPIIEEPAEPVLYYNVPIDKDLQDHIFATCEKFGVDPSLIVAIIQKESMFNASAVGDNGNSLGLMQIQPRWQKERMARLGCSDLKDPYQNITVGVDILRELLSTGQPLEYVLMSYNGGKAYADKYYYGQGVVSKYARTVINNSKALARNVTY